MKHVLDVVRIQSVNWAALFAWPLGILLLAFVGHLAFFAAIGDIAPPGGRVTGALASIYVIVGVTHLQTMTQVFPFALGLSVTRRAFYAATGMLVLFQSLVFGLVLLAFQQVELRTDGWGLQLRFFGLGFLLQDNLVAQLLIFAVPFLALSALGVFAGVVFKRWGQSGAYVLVVGFHVLAGAAALLVTLQRWWPSVGAFFTGTPTLTLLAGYPLIIAAVAGAAGFLAIRRATP